MHVGGQTACLRCGENENNTLIRDDKNRRAMPGWRTRQEALMRRDMIVGDDRHICFVVHLWVSGLVSWSRSRLRRIMARLVGATGGLRKSFRPATWLDEVRRPTGLIANISLLPLRRRRRQNQRAEAQEHVFRKLREEC